MGKFDLCCVRECRHRNMRRTSVSTRGIIQFARIFASKIDKLIHGNRRIDHQQIVDRRNHTDRNEALERIVFEVGIDTHVHGKGANVSHHQGVAVSRRASDCLGSD